jgi:hypothetical protein
MTPTESDIAMIAEQLADNSTAGLLLIENLWAKKTQQAMLDANGRLVMFERIPHDVVEEALADIAALATTKAQKRNSGDAPSGADAGANR